MGRYLYNGDSIVGIVPPTEYEVELEQRCEQLEQLCKKRLERIERLENLCARMYRLLEMSAKFPATVSGIEPTRREMQALGLLEVD